MYQAPNNVSNIVWIIQVAENVGFYAPAAPTRQGIERSSCLCVRACVRSCVRPSVGQVKIFVKGRISRPINGSKLIFHMRTKSLWEQQEYTRFMTSRPIFHGPLTSVFGHIIKFEISVQGGIISSTDSRPICYGPVILSCILKTIWWMMQYWRDWQCGKHWPETVYVGQWPIFHGPLSLPYILRIT